MYGLIAVSESGYYLSLKPTPKQERQQLLLVEIKDIIFRYIMVYYNRQRIYTSNLGSWPPAIYHERMLSQAA